MSDTWNSGDAPTNLWMQRPSGAGGMPGPQGTPPPGVTLNTVPPLPAPEATPSSAGGMPMDPADRDMMIRTIAGEAGNQPPLGQAAVAHVIMNRVADGGYGDGVQGARRSSRARRTSSSQCGTRPACARAARPRAA